jgi:hypothetical protein
VSASAYADINNGRWYPPLTRAEAWRYAKVLIRHFGSPRDAAMRPGIDGEPRPAHRAEILGKLRFYCDRQELGRRCWASSKPTQGHDTGWGRLIHDVSHIVHEYRHPKARPHDLLHAQIERNVQVFVELQGWLVERRTPTKPIISQRRELRRLKLCARLARWRTKAKRANTAIRKLNRQLRALERSSPPIDTGELRAQAEMTIT